MSERKQPSDTSRVIKNPLFAVSSLGLIEDYKERPILLPAAAPIEDEPEPKGKFSIVLHLSVWVACLSVVLFSNVMIIMDEIGSAAMTLPPIYWRWIATSWYGKEYLFTSVFNARWNIVIK